jgi:hypothetical protein
MSHQPPGHPQFLTSPREYTSMRRICWVIAGVVSAFTLTGCGETAPEGGPVEYKASNSAAIDALRKQMSDNQKKSNGMKRPEAETKPAAATKPVESQPAEAKPAPGTKASDKKE